MENLNTREGGNKLTVLFKLILSILLITINSYIGYYLYQNYNRCNLPIKYNIGNIDSRFGLSTSETLIIANDAASRWNKTSNKNILKFDPSSNIKINLVYDQRQADLDKLKIDLSSLENTNKTLTNWSDELDKMIDLYQTDYKNYGSKLNQYNSEINYWNDRGGAPEPTYTNLNNQKESLSQEATQLENRRTNINKLAGLLDSKASDYNSDVGSLKQYLDQNKNKIITQGLYYTKERKIDIFTFGDEEELRLVLMHELGHAIGLDHDNKKTSIMYSILGDQALSDPNPTEEDLALLVSICKTNNKMINIPFLNKLVGSLGPSSIR